MRSASGVAEALQDVGAGTKLRPSRRQSRCRNQLRDRRAFRPITIRFAFATGYGEQVVFPASFADAPELRKPYAMETVRATLASSFT